MEKKAAMKVVIVKACANVSLVPIGPTIIYTYNESGTKFVRFYIEDLRKGSVPIYDHRENTIQVLKKYWKGDDALRAIVCCPAQVVVVKRVEEESNRAPFHINLFPLEKGKEPKALLRGGVELWSEDYYGFYLNREKSNPLWIFERTCWGDGLMRFTLTDDEHKVVFEPTGSAKLMHGPTVVGSTIQYLEPEERPF